MEKLISRNCILVIDDIALNRVRVEQAFEGMYQVIQAENGMAGLERLQENLFSIAAIVLDMNMPVFTGLDFLREYHSNPYFFGIPVIVTTSEDPKTVEKTCLELGAMDFVQVPYDTSILVHRVINAINNCWFKRNENDLLTGVYNSEKFQVEVVKILMAHLDEQFAMAVIDIDNFKTYNDFYGVNEGDKLIQTFAHLLTKELMKMPNSIWGRYAADIFCFCIPYDEERIQSIIQEIREGLHKFNPDYIIKPSMGVYLIDDVDLDPEIMQDRAFLAAKQCKGKYEHFVAYYDQGLSKKNLSEQQIISEIGRALKQEEFVVYYQPKYNLKTGFPDGAEALVRWIHPKKGLLTPAFFVPILEKNGLITKLDFYVWERVCQFLKKRIDEHRKVSPISVNVSLVNMYNPHFSQDIYELVKNMISRRSIWHWSSRKVRSLKTLTWFSRL